MERSHLHIQDEGFFQPFCWQKKKKNKKKMEKKCPMCHQNALSTIFNLISLSEHTRQKD